MTDIRAFLKENKKEKPDTVWNGAVSLADENEIPPEFVIGAISAAENEALRVENTKPDGTFDMQRYLVRLVCRCVRVPDLNDAALQDSWGVLGEEQLILAMLSPGEYAALCRTVLLHNDFPARLTEAVDAAKK